MEILGINTAVPPNIADLGTDKKSAVFGNRGRKESFITRKNPVWDLKMGGGIWGRRYTEGRYLGDDCHAKLYNKYNLYLDPYQVLSQLS